MTYTRKFNLHMIEKDSKLSCLDVEIHRNNKIFNETVYRKEANN